MNPLDWWRLWRLRRSHPDWTILRLRYGYRAYRIRPVARDVQTGTLRSLSARITACNEQDKAAAS